MGQLAKGIQPLSFDLSANAFHNLRLALPGTELQTRFQAALAASFMLHLLIVVGVTIRPPELGKLNNKAPQLDVVLVNSRTATAPAKADALAQANLDGGGNADADRRAKSPLPLTRRSDAPAPKLAVQTPKAKARKRDTQKRMTQSREPAPAVAQPEPKNQNEPVSEPVQSPRAVDIVSRSMEMARLEAQIAKNWDTYQKRPRRRFIGARTQEFRFARYVEDWRIKIERIGTLNYPQAARDQRIFGRLQLTVAIRRDGSVVSVEIDRSSGRQILDQAAQRIVHLAAPFAAFPPDIAKDIDILSITRTWSFTRSDRFQQAE